VPDDLAERLADLRPRLHRYAARMMGSAFDGEDVVQDAMAKLSLENAVKIDDLEAWMLRVTHTCAIDAMRRRQRQAARDARVQADTIGSGAADRRVAVTASLASFLSLAPGPRSAVVLVDVLGHTIAETAAILDMTEAAVKAALNRGRRKLQEVARDDVAPVTMSAEERQQLQRYADSFNEHDWDALRAMLAEDVRLDLVNRVKLSGAASVSVYFSRYEEAPVWRVELGRAEHLPALLFRPVDDPDAAPGYVVLLTWAEGRIARIRDFFFARYVMEGLEWAPEPDAAPRN
jgi:RNA polymerase sigma-70 factor (ECF subfamily)